jgi:BirA family transcriptional regulator, biotin operon repressor / biotin---[acetyl-CoA-carboxylase] ligase
MEIKTTHLEKVDSTNKWAKQNIHEFNKDLITCITADEQTDGYGHFQRKWISPKGKNINATFCFLLKKDTLHLTSIGQVIAFSLAKVLMNLNFSPKIRWPNDILLSNKKLSGVLCETKFEKEDVHLFLGIGININTEKNDLQKIDQLATSLKEESSKEFDKEKILKLLQDEFIANLQIFKKEGFTPFHSQIENLLAYKGEQITCTDGKKEYCGICHSLTNDGRLNLFLPEEKKIKTFSSGEVHSIRSF